MSNRCLGEHPAYGCKHFKEHQEAARKGWFTRRAHAVFRSSDEHDALKHLFGAEVVDAHEHQEHPGKVRYRYANKWIETSKAEFANLVAHGRALRREKLLEEIERNEQDEKAQREYERWVKKLEREAEKELARKRTLEEREAERARIREQRQQERYEDDEIIRMNRATKALHADVVKFIRASGGIRPMAIPSTSSKTKPADYEEWKELPASVRVNSGDRRIGTTMDDMARSVGYAFPETGIEKEDDLLKFFRDAKAQRNYYSVKEQRRINAALRERQREEEGRNRAPAHSGAPRISVVKSSHGWYGVLTFPDGHVQQTKYHKNKVEAEKEAQAMRGGGGVEVDRPRLLTEVDVIKNAENAGYSTDLFG